MNLPSHLKGLSQEQVLESRKKFGANEQQENLRSTWLQVLLAVIREPMLVLLIAIAAIYFVMGQLGEAYFMIAALLFVSGISIYQDTRSQKALEALKNLNEPLTGVMRDGEFQNIPTSEIVVGDLVVVEEGRTINADGNILHSNDFSVNESSLTGESYSVFKSPSGEDRRVFSGTLVSSGLAVFEVTEVGKATRIGQLGKSLAEIKEEASPLQVQVSRFVRTMAIAGIMVFLLVWGYNYLYSQNLLASLLKGLTLAMSILPEEIPVAFTTFMTLGAWRLMKEGIIVKRTSTVESLGSATVICTDKTGTITENKMSLQAVYAFHNRTLYQDPIPNTEEPRRVIENAMWASEPVPFDPMEKTLHAWYGHTTARDERTLYTMVHEYPLEGQPPMMTHIFEDEQGHRRMAAKGAPEAILAVSDLDDAERSAILRTLEELARDGYRILGVASSSFKGTSYPPQQQKLPFQFEGLVVFFDPPKENIKQVFNRFYEAGITVKIISGDNPFTTRAIAERAGLRHPEKTIDGKQIMELEEEARISILHETNILTRMYPEAKVAAVKALQEDNQVVAMLGDGVNDAPALKAAHIGIAMGQKGTEIAKAAAALIIVDDDLSRVADGVAAGRRIYTNIKKAVQYIISIHIPIILTVSLPLFLGWVYPDIFTPVHVIFLELVMGPTCSIVYENEPMEKNAMNQPPRALSKTFLSFRELGLSIAQGLAISAAVLYIYQHTAGNGGSEELTRAMVFTTLIFANIFLTWVNRSFYYSFISSFTNRNSLMVYIVIATLALLAAILYIPPVSAFFKLNPLSISQLLHCMAIGALSVLWFEIWKAIKRMRG